MEDLQEEIEIVIDQPYDVARKINAISLLIHNKVKQQLIEQEDQIAEDILFGRIHMPKVVEFTCRLS